MQNAFSMYAHPKTEISSFSCGPGKKKSYSLKKKKKRKERKKTRLGICNVLKEELRWFHTVFLAILSLLTTDIKILDNEKT